MTNIFNRASSYEILFDNACGPTDTFAGYVGTNATANVLKPPFPTIANIDPYGKVTISWNVSLLVPTNTTTQNKSQPNCFSTSPLTVQVLPG